MKEISLKQYMMIDLFILAVIVFVFESVTALAASRWFPAELYTLSPTITVVCIVMMRWGGYAAVQAAAGGLAFCLVTGASLEQFAVYCAGNCLSLAALLFFKFLGKEKVRSKAYLSALFAASAFVGAQIGRWAVSLVFGGSPASLGTFFAADSLTLVFTVVAVLVSRRADGLFEDQKSYLIRTEAERRKQQAADYYK